MRPLAFYLVTLVSIAYAAVALAKFHEAATLDKASHDLQNLQPLVVRADQNNQFARMLIQRLVVESAQDPALLDLMARHGLKPFSGQPPDNTKAATNENPPAVPTPSTASSP